MKRFPSCVMATCVVPWDDQYRFAESVFRRLVRSMLAGTKHLYLFGTAGEGYAVTDRQFDQIVAAFIDEMRQGGAEPMVGVIHLSLGTILERIERCRDHGVRQFQISLPSWGPLNQREVFDFFARVCGRFRDCQFIHYNLPRTKRLVTPDEYGRLAAEHPNLVATKNCNDSFSTTARLLGAAPEVQHFFGETGYLWGSLLGECGLLASYVTNWGKVQRVFEAGRKRDLPAMIELEKDVQQFSAILGPLAENVHIDGAFDKLFARLTVPEFHQRLLPPYHFMSDEQYRQFEAAMREKLPGWLPDNR